MAAAPAPTEAIVADSLVVPWDLAFLPDGRMVATERPGRIRVFDDGSPGAALQRTVTVPDVELGTGEAGVMGVAVDTDFGAFPYLYVCASRKYDGSGGWVNEVLRYSVTGSTAWSAPTVLLGGMKAGRTHNGCALEMDDAGHLWVAMGDGGTEALAQDRSSRSGKVLRMTRTGGIPADNPVIDGIRDHVYSMGHRNPQGLAFQPGGTGRVYAVEHGPSVDDEINLLVAGGNYGWPCETGAGISYRPETAGCDDGDTYLAPAWASGTSTIATSGATFLRGAQWGDLEGDLVVPTLKEQDLRVFDVDAEGVLAAGETRYDGTYGRLRGAVSGPGGRLYLTTSNGSDKIVRVSPADLRPHPDRGCRPLRRRRERQPSHLPRRRQRRRRRHRSGLPRRPRRQRRRWPARDAGPAQPPGRTPRRARAPSSSGWAPSGSGSSAAPRRCRSRCEPSSPSTPARGRRPGSAGRTGTRSPPGSAASSTTAGCPPSSSPRGRCSPTR